MKAEEILAITDLNEKIKRLTDRETTLPDANSLLKDWDQDKHDVMDPTVRKKLKIQTQEEERDATGKIIKEAKFDYKELNRITLPIEQDIVNIHTAFTLGTEPKLTSNAKSEGEKSVFEVLKSVLRYNKVKYHNKRAMRSWLSETEVAEYWYKVEDGSWWKKVLRMLSFSATPKTKLKVDIWSPFRGDELYPLFDEKGDMVLFTRKYKDKDENGNEYDKYMVIDKKFVRTISTKGGESKEGTPIAHGFEKLPVMYMYRAKPFCHKIKTIRNRLETLLSNYADCIDYNFAPKLAARGAVEEIQNRGSSNEIIVLEEGAEVSYLSWQQTPDMAKLEFDNLTERCYSLTNTPRISFENLSGMGNAFSGVAFEFAFMGAHMAVHIHAEDVEEYLQRRVNFLLSAIGSIAPKLKSDADNITVEVEIVPYIINDEKGKVDLAVSAVVGGIASKRSGIILAGLTDQVDEELKLIAEENVAEQTV